MRNHVEIIEISIVLLIIDAFACRKIIRNYVLIIEYFNYFTSKYSEKITSLVILPHRPHSPEIRDESRLGSLSEAFGLVHIQPNFFSKQVQSKPFKKPF